MSNQINDGGPAFPRTGVDGHTSPQTGMSLRIWLAGQALNGWAAGRNHTMMTFENSKHEDVAKACLKYADAIIRAAQEAKP